MERDRRIEGLRAFTFETACVMLGVEHGTTLAAAKALKAYINDLHWHRVPGTETRPVHWRMAIAVPGTGRMSRRIAEVRRRRKMGGFAWSLGSWPGEKHGYARTFSEAKHAATMAFTENV